MHSCQYVPSTDQMVTYLPYFGAYFGHREVHIFIIDGNQSGLNCKKSLCYVYSRFATFRFWQALSKNNDSFVGLFFAMHLCYVSKKNTPGHVFHKKCVLSFCLNQRFSDYFKPKLDLVDVKLRFCLEMKRISRHGWPGKHGTWFMYRKSLKWELNIALWFPKLFFFRSPVTDSMKRICIAFNPCLQLRGDVLIKCYNKKQNSATRDVIFRCQFHTCAISDYVLNFTKSELDDACEGALFIYFPRAVPVLTYGREFFTCFTCLSVILFTAVKSRISFFRMCSHWTIATAKATSLKRPLLIYMAIYGKLCYFARIVDCSVQVDPSYNFLLGKKKCDRMRKKLDFACLPVMVILDASLYLWW